MIVRKNMGGSYGALRRPAESRGLSREIIAVKKYLRDHCREQVDGRQAARALGLSETYIGKMFGREVGATISQYVLICRMEESAELLVTTSMRITEISDAVGMNTPGWYTKCFHRCYGVSPSEYRIREQNGLPLPELSAKVR